MSQEKPRFWQSEPIELWSAEVRVMRTYSDFLQIVRDLSRTRHEPYNGYFTRTEDGYVKTFTRTRYPRIRYGLPDIESFETGTKILAHELSKSFTRDTQRTGFRVVLGLLEGYDKTEKLHKIEEVTETLPGKSTAQAAEVLSVRPTDAEPTVYTEQVVVIRSSTLRDLNAIKLLAETFQQERFVVEDFSHREAYMIETQHVVDSDAGYQV